MKNMILKMRRIQLSVKMYKVILSFDNVHFSYNEKEEVLKDINLDVKKGETIALVGMSGGGKSYAC